MAHQRPKGPARKLSAEHYAGLVARGEVGPKDRYGNPISKDDLVEYRSILAGVAEPFWQVTDIKPVLDRHLPSGMVKLEIKSTAYVTVPVNQPQHQFLIIGHVDHDEAGKGTAELRATDEPAPPPPSGITLTDSDSDSDTGGGSHGPATSPK